MNIIVTGASGLVGSSAVQIASQSNAHTIHAVSRNQSTLNYPSNVHTYTHISELPSLNQYDLLFHAAAATPSNADSSQIYDINKRIDHDVFSFISSTSVSNVTYLSSMSIYGTISESIISEETLPSSPNPYGQSKLEGEILFRSLHQSSSLSILRLPGVVGSSMSKIFFRRVYESLLSSEPIKVRSLDSPFNNVVFVDDIFHTSFSLTHSDYSSPLVLNMHSINILPIENFLSYFAQRLNLPLRINCDCNLNPPFIISNRANANLVISRSLESIIDSFCIDCGH